MGLYGKIPAAHVIELATGSDFWHLDISFGELVLAAIVGE